ncbi:MAG: efflux transporter outer membrane subunit [Verrucomicrobia bacterium]|nr:efflux transporter outer membrane subunit [Verrucomicrobiota bacterium]MDE3097993.1 efflux transporter outer membrane subunit [Verrucomicrobiota bacterium]
MRKPLSMFAVIAGLALAGCTLIPKYQRPAPAIAPAWPAEARQAAGPTNATIRAADIGWRQFFRDARLRQLITLALSNNPDLRAATLNVQQTRALYAVQGNALIPTGNINANATRQRIAYGYAGHGNSTTYSQYNVNLGVASYELDLFGRVRSLKRQALETYFASEEARKSAQIALVSQVAGAYLMEREAADQLSVARETLAAANTDYELSQRSHDEGVLSDIQLNAVQAQMDIDRVLVANYQQQFVQARDALALLVGRPLPNGLTPAKPFNPKICLADIPAGLPSDLLERRPDILEAEHQLKAANANIGAARAAFFPTVTLTGSAGTASTTLESLFAPGSETWAFSPQIVWPIFGARTAWDELQAIKAQKLIAAAQYQKAVQTAFREVADSLAARTNLKIQLSANEGLVAADGKNYQLAQALFSHGVDSQLDVLAAREALDSVRQSLIQSRYSRLFNLINLYQALGGGWRENSPGK